MPVSPKSLANLKRYPKGVSGNPGGKPRKKPLTEAYEKIVRNPREALAIAQGIVRVARKGNVKAAVEIADRVEGKVTQGIEIHGDADILAALAAGRERARAAKGES